MEATTDNPDELAPQAVLAELERVLRSRFFANSEVRSRFLRFVVEETLEGRGETLKETVVGDYVFGRGYDPRADGRVRRHAPEVRRNLRSFYEAEGRNDPIVIAMPPREQRYTPEFRRQASPEPVQTVPDPPWKSPKMALAAAVSGPTLVLALAVLLPGFRSWISDVAGWLPHEKHLAVLEFQVTGGDNNQRRFTEGLREALVNKLKRLEGRQPNLWVVATEYLDREKVKTALEARRAFRATLSLGAKLVVSSGEAHVEAWLENTETGRTLKRKGVDAGSLTEIQGPLEGLVIGWLKTGFSSAETPKLDAGSTASPEVRKYYITGLGYLQRGRDWADEAIGLFQRALEIDQDFALGYSGLANAYLLKYSARNDPGALNLAEEACNNGLKRNAAVAQLHETLGNIHSIRGRYDQAEQECWKAIGIDPQNEEAFRRLGLAQEQLGKYDDAEKTYRQAIDLRPDKWSGHTSLALFYFYRNRLAEAEKKLHDAQELAPDNRVILVNQVAVYIKRNDELHAEQSLQRCLGIRPDRPDPDCLTNLGILLHFQGRHDAAALQYERAIQAGGETAQRLLNLSAVYRWSSRASHREKVKPTLERALQLGEAELQRNPNNAESHARVALCHAHLDHTAEALRKITKARELGNENSVVIFQSVRVLERIGRREEAIAAHRALCAMSGGIIIREIQKDPDLAEFRKDEQYRAAECSQGLP